MVWEAKEGAGGGRQFNSACSPFINVVDLQSTVKLGYNELVYNEHSVITNDFFSPKWSSYYITKPGYNETRL
jgi:hypothetical protein